MAKVSIVITIYNVEDWVDRCLQSIVGQSLHDIEIVVVDDGTPDNSMQIVRQFAKDDQRFHLIAHERNKGLMQARRTGYMAATGDYVMFCDSDDYMPLDAVEKLYHEAVRTGADIVSGDMTLVFSGGRSEMRRVSRLSLGSDMLSVYKSLLVDEYHHNLCGKLFKRGLLQDYDYVTVDHFTNGEDGFLFYQVVEHVNKVVHLNEPVYFYFQNGMSLSKNRYGERGVRSICMLNQLRLQLCERHPEIKRYFQAKVSSVISSLYARGYDKDANLDDFVKTYSLSDYASWWSVFKYNPLPKAGKMFLKRLLR